MDQSLSTSSSSSSRITKREIHDSDIDIKCDTQHNVKLMSYNIWDKEEYWEERTQQVIRIVKDNAPDVCCLLEVSENCYKDIFTALDPFYIVFQVFIEEGNRVGTVLLCRRGRVDLPNNSQPYYYDFNTGDDASNFQGRVIGVELVLLSNNEKLHVLCTKLDDHQDYDHVRSDQFKVIQQVIKGLRNCVVMGDFNIFRDDEEINHDIMTSKLHDSWIKIGCPAKVKYTFDGKRNNITQDKSRLRASRIYYSGSHLSIRSLSLVGTNKISSDLPITPSCHYGIVGIFKSN
jgi:endonuclease/exonuclease/phosphatase family metal-dependent hydrolase